jgi:phosphoribosylformimino-5-aminoimidazole carboxamide ribotide isomerase
MSTFTLYPAIDLLGGSVVRLEYGDPARQTTFGADPVATARRWLSAGANWLHVVNLDGAFAEAGGDNWRLLPRLAQTGARIQFGGGLRTLDDVMRARDSGAARLVLGTAVLENPDLVDAALAAFGPQAVVAALDARAGRVSTRGWQRDSNLRAEDVGHDLYARGLRLALHTDIGRDGVLTGVNVAATAALAEASGLSVIASGGVASLADVRRAAAAAPRGVAGLVIGRALYDGKVDLAEALAMLDE